MKKILILALASASLAGCSTYHSAMDSIFGDSSNSVSVNSNQDGDNPEEELSGDPEVSISLKNKKKSHAIKAEVTTDWNGVPQGTIYLTWQAPKDSKCYNTSFPVTKFKEIQDITYDTQSTLSDGKVCKGTWTAIATNKSNDKELASQSVEIK